MSIIASAVKHMLAAGMPHDAIVAAVEEMEAQIVDVQAERRRAKDRERKRLRNSAESAEKVSPLCPPNKDTPTPPEINPPYIPPSKQHDLGRADDVSARMPELYAAAGVTDETKPPGLLAFSEPIRWVVAGCDIDLDIIPALRSIAARGRTVRSWAYCSDAVFEARDRRLAPAPAVQSRPGTSPPPRKPRNAGEAARLELIRRGEYPDASSYITGSENESDRNTGFAGTDIARRIAIAAGG